LLTLSLKLVNIHFPFLACKQSFQSCWYSDPLLEGVQGCFESRHTECTFDHYHFFLWYNVDQFQCVWLYHIALGYGYANSKFILMLKSHWFIQFILKSSKMIFSRSSSQIPCAITLDLLLHYFLLFQVQDSHQGKYNI